MNPRSYQLQQPANLDRSKLGRSVIDVIVTKLRKDKALMKAFGGRIYR